MKIHPWRYALSKNFGACRCPKRVLVGAKKGLAILGIRAEPQQRPERAPMHHAEALVVVWSENQGVNIVAPCCRFFQADVRIAT